MLRRDPDVDPESRPRVVLVEDDAAVRRSLQLLLQGRGYDVRAYASGVALLVDPAAGDAACFIADYRLAELDGIEILSELRRRKWHGPAVLITAFVSPDLTERAKAAGFDADIAKPFLDHFLVDEIGRLVRGEGSHAAASQ
jgi:FixJ family two-component response regulator